MPDNPEQAIKWTTEKGHLILILSLTSFLLSIVLSSPFLTALSIGAAMIMVNSWARSSSGRGHYRRVIVPEETFSGGVVKVQLEGEVSSGGGVATLVDEVPPTVREMIEARWRVAPGERLGNINYRARAVLRGIYRLGPLTGTFSDPGGHVERMEVLEPGGDVTVLPEVVHSNVLPRLKALPRLLPGFSRSRSLGQGKEFHSIREYRPEDPFKQINWPATARRRKIMVNQYEAESLTDVVIILDAREWTGAGDLLENPLEDSIRIAASAIRALLMVHNRVGLVIIGEGVRYVRPSGGEKHLLYLLHELAAVSPQGQVPLLKALKVSTKYFTPSSPIILISPFSEGLEAKEALEYLLSLGHPLTVISPDALEREARILGVKPPRYYLKKIERHLVLSTLSQAGVKLADVPPTPDIPGVLKEVME